MITGLQKRFSCILNQVQTKEKAYMPAQIPVLESGSSRHMRPKPSAIIAHCRVQLN